MTNAQHQKLKPLSLSLGIRKHLGKNFKNWRKNYLIHIWWFSSLYKMMKAVRQDIHCSNLNTWEKLDLPVTCNNDIKSIRDIWYFFLIPMQCHRAHSCSTKCSRIGIYIKNRQLKDFHLILQLLLPPWLQQLPSHNLQI